MKNTKPSTCFRIFFFLLPFLLIPLSATQKAGSQDKPWTVESHDKTNFPLIGKHRTVACGECHLKGVLQGTPTSCEACHWYRKQDDRYHLQLGIHCGDCHSPVDWKQLNPGSWKHELATGFVLEGTHRILDCFQCHKNNTLSAIPRDCYSCHRDNYERATDPDHLQAGFPNDCSLCHNMISWESGEYSHQSFILKGNHKTADCSACHRNGQYVGTPKECVACHLDDYNRTQDPNHLEAGFPTQCEICHGDEGFSWENASFNHDLFFPLRGAHQNLDCNKCHENGYNLPTNCYGCHKADYDATTSPNHRSAGFPTDCEYCHFPNHVSWNQAVFNHAFPIKSGEHAGFDCTECHLTSNFSQFSCIDCHEHNKSKMDGIHKDISGYQYNSQACYSCHPQGKE